MIFFAKTIHCSGGLNNFRYLASLSLHGGDFDPREASQNLELSADRIGIRGEAHPTIAGKSSAAHFWHRDVTFLGRDGDSLDQFLQRLVDRLKSHARYLQQLSHCGVEVECFVGVFLDGGCDTAISHRLLSELATLRINLRLDVYGPEIAEPRSGGSA